jgi:hypothetical protein
MATISLIEEFLLLTLEDSGGEFDSAPEIFVDCGIAGAALMDLALRNRIDSDLEAVWVSDATPTGDPILDGVLPGVWMRETGSHAFRTRRAPCAPPPLSRSARAACSASRTINICGC